MIGAGVQETPDWNLGVGLQMVEAMETLLDGQR